MSVLTMGYIVSGLVVALMAALVMWMEARGQSRYYQGLYNSAQKSSLLRQQEITKLNLAISKLEMERTIRLQVQELLEKDIKISHEHINHYLETIAAQEQLINDKDQELNGLEDNIRALEKSSPEHIRALLLDKLAENKNLGYLNKLLEDANSGYSNDLKDARQMIDRLVRKLQENEIEPDLEPCEAATSAEPDPAEEPIEESCCF
jgi:DNA repair exonuclease SbcCD ATPase subunit